MMAGTVLAGRYELGERLGLGGMSTVVLAFDRRLERHVAVKLLAEHLAEDGQFVSRFRREALSAARLVHPNIVQVFDFGLDGATGRHYIVMEYVEGSSGAEILRDDGILSVRKALSIVTQACRGLEYAHRNGVVHRDVKPGNLLRGEDGIVKLADFGIAKALSEESSITQVGSVLGTAAYLAPEQAAGEEIGPQADLYALGVVTYQFLSGRLPYEAQSLTELALKQQREVPTRLDELNPDVSATLAVAVEQALALDPRHRYGGADEMRAALTDGARGIGPATSATRIAGPATTGTTVRPRYSQEPPTDATAATGVVQQRAPHAPRSPRPAAAPPPMPTATPPARRREATQARQAQRRRRARARRTLALIVVLLALAAAGAAAVIATSGSTQAVKLRRVVYDDVNKAVDSMQQLVNDNTK